MVSGLVYAALLSPSETENACGAPTPDIRGNHVL